MGIAQWVRRTPEHAVGEMQVPVSISAVSVEQTTLATSGMTIPDMGAAGSIQSDLSEPSNSKNSVKGVGDAWVDLKSRVSHCHLCGLHETRTQTVFGAGSEQADWFVVGDAPGVDEDRLGEPFVGQAGKLLDNMLVALGLQRNAIYITNIIKCGLPNKRDPSPEEVAHCAHFLNEQVSLVRPKIILAVGRVAAQNLLKTDVLIGKMRGIRHNYDYTVFNNLTSNNTGQRDEVTVSIPLVVTYHPAYLLRSPREKRKSWQDLKFAQSIMQSL